MPRQGGHRVREGGGRQGGQGAGGCRRGWQWRQGRPGGGAVRGAVGRGQVHHRGRGAGRDVDGGLGGRVGGRHVDTRRRGDRDTLLVLEVGLVEVELHLADGIVVLVIDGDHLGYHG